MKGDIKMNNKKTKKFFNWAGKITMKVLPVCALAMTVLSANATACWINGQEEPPVNLRKYRKF